MQSKSNYVLILSFLLVIGAITWVLISKKKKDSDATMLKAWQFVQDQWTDNKGDQFKAKERLNLEDCIIEEGYYDGEAGTERFFGFNVTKMDDNQRIIFIVGTKPTLHMAKVYNSPRIPETASPFIGFISPPTPVPGFKSPIDMNLLRKFREQNKKVGFEDEWIGDAEEIKGGQPLPSEGAR